MAEPRTEILEKFGGAPHSKQSLRLWLKMLGCTTVIENAIRNRLRETFDTTLPRFDVLAALDRNPGGLTMGELSRFLMVSNGNVTGVVNRLAADGLVERSLSPTDRRTHHVRLTPEGARQFAAMASVHETWVDELFGEIDDAEAEAMLGCLRRLQSALAGRKSGDRAKG